MKTKLDRSPGPNRSPCIIRPSLQRGPLLALLLAILSGVPCPTARSETTNALLTLYIVFDKQIEGGRFFNAPRFQGSVMSPRGPILLLPISKR